MLGDIRDVGLIPGLGRSPGGGASCLENPMDRGAWQAIVQRVATDSDRTEWLSTNTIKIATLLGAGTRQIQVLLFETFWKFFSSSFDLQLFQSADAEPTDTEDWRPYSLRVVGATPTISENLLDGKEFAVRVRLYITNDKIIFSFWATMWLVFGLESVLTTKTAN